MPMVLFRNVGQTVGTDDVEGIEIGCHKIFSVDHKPGKTRKKKQDNRYILRSHEIASQSRDREGNSCVDMRNWSRTQPK